MLSDSILGNRTSGALAEIIEDVSNRWMPSFTAREERREGVAMLMADANDTISSRSIRQIRVWVMESRQSATIGMKPAKVRARRRQVRRFWEGAMGLGRGAGWLG